MDNAQNEDFVNSMDGISAFNQQARVRSSVNGNTINGGGSTIVPGDFHDDQRSLVTDL